MDFSFIHGLKFSVSFLAEAALREPKFKTPLKPQEVPKGQDVTFTAVVTGDPIPEVKWQVNIQVVA